jgi:hypothetical protein
MQPVFADRTALLLRSVLGLNASNLWVQTGAFMSHLQALATVLNDLADHANDSELENALELCLGFADRIDIERPDSHESDEVTEATLPRRPNTADRWLSNA